MHATVAIIDASGVSAPCRDTVPLRLAAMALDAPRRDQPLVRIEAAGLCHADLSVINGDRPRPMPMAPGHDAVATNGKGALHGGGFRLHEDGRDGHHHLIPEGPA